MLLAKRESHMAVPPIDDVKQVLRDFEHRIRLVVERAWAEWQGLPDRGRFVFVPRMRATFVFDRIASHAITEFNDDKHIHVIIKKQTVRFVFQDKVIVRFKLSNVDGVGSNILTQEVLDFIDPQRTIPGLIPDIMKIEICYRPDDLGLNLDEVAVVARDHRRRLWSYPIEPAAPAAPVVPIPPRGPDESPPVLVPRRPAAEGEEETGKQ